MKKYGKATLMGACALLGLSAVSCTPGERGAVVGGAIGAGTGALIGDGTGALIGGAIGAAAGSEISKNRAHRNYYYGH
ncbi:MAG: glycine zipper domain-containing protein [Verrucomicrobiales bacterium]|nr:glycine zipper domain-containing protein [Verrucomicrobiales bacterium]